MQHFSNHIDILIEQFAKLPGIGRKTAQRLAFHVINLPQEEVQKLADAVVNAKQNIMYCDQCCNIADSSLCSICGNPSRDASIICVVEDPRDVAALERSREYRGKYHVLHGTIYPMDCITPDMLKIKELIKSLADSELQEVILATYPTRDGEATAMYIARLIKPFGIKVTRIAHGLPVGGDIEYADDVTITKALEGRREL